MFFETLKLSVRTIMRNALRSILTVLGVVIGGMVICMFLPIFKMSEIINGNK